MTTQEHILWHEAGHAAVASRLGFPVVDVVGWACAVDMPEEPEYYDKLAAMTIAGPTMQSAPEHGFDVVRTVEAYEKSWREKKLLRILVDTNET